MRQPILPKSLLAKLAVLASAAALFLPGSAAVVNADSVVPISSAGSQVNAGKAVPLHVAFGPAGLTSIKAGDTEFVSDGDLQITECKIAGNGNNVDDAKPLKSTFDPATNTLSRVYPWGKVTAIYRVESDRLNIDLSATNTGNRLLMRLAIQPLQVRFPVALDGDDFANHNSVSSERNDDLPVLMANWRTGHFALCSENLDQFEPFGLRNEDDLKYGVWARFGGEPFRGGTTRETTLSIRIGDAAASGDNGWPMVHDLLQRYAAKYPSELKWDDHRPIGSAFLATSQKGYAKNPRGWLLDPDIDVTTPEGRAAFKTKMMAYADSVVLHCKMMNAQGVIVWDLEGQEMPHATSYLADPRMLSKVAPEMDAFADEFMKKFTDAGLRTGLTIRPTRVAPADQGRAGWMQQDVSDQVAEIDQKLTYAEKRWGCTLFYVDSNVDFVKDAKGKVLFDPAMPATGFQKLAREHKNCLLMPEHKTARYWAYTAPYSEFRLGIAGTPQSVREAYPNAFSLLRVVDGPSLSDPDSIAKLTTSIKNGDILLFRPWWDDPQTTDIKHIYDLVASEIHP